MFDSYIVNTYFWKTKNRNQAEMIAKKYGADVYKRNEKILDFK